MASYTMELRRVCDIYTRDEVESWFKDYNLTDFLTSEQITTITTAGLWTKEKLARKIVDHYFMREIGFETPYLFRHFAKVKMQEIMESKLPLIYSKSIEFDPMVNVDFEEKFSRNIIGTKTENTETSVSEEVEETRENEGTSESSSTNNQSGLTVNSDTPQGQITKANILAGSYATSTSANENESSISDETSTSSSNSGSLSRSNDLESENRGQNTQSEQSTRTMKGNSGSLTTAQNLIKQYRDIIIAVDKEIIEELNSLFIALF